MLARFLVDNGLPPPVHHTGKVALERDSIRRNARTALGLRVVTATAADLRDRARRLTNQLRPLLQTPPHANWRRRIGNIPT